MPTLAEGEEDEGQDADIEDPLPKKLQNSMVSNNNSFAIKPPLSIFYHLTVHE